MLVIGHRGAAGYEPENTLRSIARAIDLGADWIEVDVQEVDGELIVFHDDTLERTTNGLGPVSERSFASLRSLDAGEGERIPTLVEVLDLIGARAGLNIELKSLNIADAVIATVDAFQANDPSWRERILLSSFDSHQTEELAERGADYRLGYLFQGDAKSALARARELNAYSIHPSMEHVNTELVADAHATGMKVLVYTVNEPDEIAAMRALGVDGVFSDFPDRVRALQMGEG
jgi:glycerophosphoryl diester phosphodiesterase